MKNILITGANRGIGLGFSAYYANAGWHVYACCRNPKNATNLKNLSQKNSSVSMIQADVSKFSDIQKLAKVLQNKPIDILINNAGILGAHESFGNIETEFWVEALKVNTIAPLLIAQALLPNLRLGQCKIIANISSCLGSISDNDSGAYYCYRSSKAALNAVTKSMAIDLKNENITTIAMHPGWVKTDMGGEDAQITVSESVQGLTSVLNSIKLNDSGKFLDYQGKLLDW